MNVKNSIQESRSRVSTFSGFPGTGAPTVGYERDGTQIQRSFVPIQAKYPRSYFLHERPSLQPPDGE